MMGVPTWFPIVIAAMIGAAVGSFLNVCIYRWPADESVIRPASRCPGCGHALAWYDNVPIFGWLWLRGSCRYCGKPISMQYPVVELATALLWAAAILHFGPTIEGLRAALFLSILLGIAMTDAREMVIPDQFSLGGTLVGILFAAVPGGFSLTQSLIGALFGYAGLWVVKIVAEKALGKPALGVGDIHMMAFVGAFTGWSGALLTLMIGSFAGLLIGVPLTWLRGRLSPMATYLPLGTFLAIGGAISYFWGTALLAWYARFAFGAY
jgi:leader peptidase (prepilin peptidase) / N-methyltransferase